MTDNRDPQLEALLSRYAASIAEVVAIPLADIDRDDAAQVRDQVFDPEVVERYVAALEDGVTFPPILLRALGDRLVPVTGRHRIEAHEAAGRLWIDAYVAVLCDEVAFAIAVEDNTRHGLPLTTDERCRLGLTFVDQGETVQVAARRVGLTTNMLDRARARRDGAIRAEALSVGRSWHQLASSSQSRLMSLRDDAVFGLVVATAVAQRWNTDQVYRLTTELGRTPDDPMAQMMAVGDFEVEVESARLRNPLGTNHIGTVRGACLKLIDLDVDRAVSQCRADDRHATAQRARRAGMLLLSLANKLDA